MDAAALDETHDPGRTSWVQSANGGVTDFPLQNLPLGIAVSGAAELTVVAAIGDHALDLAGAAAAGLLDTFDPALLRGPARLNALLAHPGPELTALRHSLVAILESGSKAEATIRADDGMLRPIAGLELVTPTRIGSFTDFFAGIYHARTASRILNRGGDIGPNYRWIPIAYQSRASTVRPSGATVRRPAGQLPQADADPSFAPCAKLDFELELGFYVGRATVLGEPVPISQAADHIAGFCLLNDWSARDIQRWEMAPLGPFLAKSFATTISPWIVTVDALRPFRVPAMERGDGEPQPLPYLRDDPDQAAGGLTIELAAWLRTSAMRERGDDRALLLRSNARHLYWTPAQILAHHTSGGCDLQTGDLLGSGTISGPTEAELASLLELGADGQKPVTLPDGESRSYLEDGDEVTFTGRCVRDGFASIGFGECTGTVTPTNGTPH
jgi:fumarylacetoacetase